MINCTIILEAHDGFVKHMLIPFPPPTYYNIRVQPELKARVIEDEQPDMCSSKHRTFCRTQEVYAGVYLYKEV